MYINIGRSRVCSTGQSLSKQFINKLQHIKIRVYLFVFVLLVLAEFFVLSSMGRSFMCTQICGCSWKARIPACLHLPLPATTRRCRSCPGTPGSAGARWQRCSVRWHIGPRTSTEHNKSEKNS